MSDLDRFLELMRKAKSSFVVVERIAPTEYGDEWKPVRRFSGDGEIVAVDEEPRNLRDFDPSPKTTTVVRVMPGYRCHFEAAFDADGNIIDAGQFETL